MGAGKRERGGVEDAVGRPIAPRWLPGRLGDYRLCAPEIVTHLPRRQAQEAAVPMAVQGNLVAGRGDLGGELVPALHLLANEEEGCLHLGLAEELEDRRSPLRVRSVVEGEQGSTISVKAVPHAQAKAKRRTDRGCAGKPVGADREPCKPREQQPPRPAPWSVAGSVVAVEPNGDRQVPVRVVAKRWGGDRKADDARDDVALLSRGSSTVVTRPAWL
jgi:hypothetical protein